MTTVLIVVHLMVVLAMIGLVLLQRSEGGALGIGGGQGAFLTGRGAGNVLTRSTAVLAAIFFATSLGLALLARLESRPSDILERLPASTAPATETPQPPVPAGEPSSAEELLESLGGASDATPGPQAPPAAGGAEAPAPEAQAPAAGASDAAPATEAPAPGPQTPPAPAQ
jgi:preprotein translocase subunit SecG